MEKFIKVKDVPSLVRDSESNAILNTDVVSLTNYKQTRDRIMKLERAAAEVDSIKKEITEMRQLISEILSTKDKEEIRLSLAA